MWGLCKRVFLFQKVFFKEITSKRFYLKLVRCLYLAATVLLYCWQNWIGVTGNRSAWHRKHSWRSWRSPLKKKIFVIRVVPKWRHVSLGGFNAFLWRPLILNTKIRDNGKGKESKNVQKFVDDPDYNCLRCISVYKGTPLLLAHDINLIIEFHLPTEIL